MSVFNASTLGAKADIVAGAILIIFVIVSLSLNCFVIGYQALKSRSNIGRLYMILGISDTLSILTVTTVMIYHFLSKSQVQLRFPFLLSSALISTTTLQLSGYIMTVISIYRYLIVRNPLTLSFRRKRDMKAVGSALFLLSVIGTILQLQCTKWNWSYRRQVFDVPNCLSCNDTHSFHAFNLTIILRFCYVLNSVISIGISVMTIVRLHRTEENGSTLCLKFRKSCITIFIMNLISLVVIVGIATSFICQISFQKRHLNTGCRACQSDLTERYQLFLFLGYPIAPLFLALTNPMVIIFRGSDIRHCLQNSIKFLCRMPRSNPTTPTSLYSSSINLALHRVTSINCHRNSILTTESNDILSGVTSLTNSGISFSANINNNNNPTTGCHSNMNNCRLSMNSNNVPQTTCSKLSMSS